MMISDAQRRQLHDALAAAIGDQPSELLMELLPPTGWADLATRTDLEIARTDLRMELHDFRSELKVDIQDLKAELKSDIQQVRTELSSDLDEVRGELQEQRIEFTERFHDLEGRVDAIYPRLVNANIASMAGIAGLVIAAGALF
ncbi:MAG: hypothetical protein GY925_10505 [Actinomycetia bacterium]|nr:hypothetical protein [Actinomycetes bacterium]